MSIGVRIWIVVGGLVVCNGPLLRAQLQPPEPQPIVGARMPALSPDGKRLAFVYRGDIWAASDRGGRALPVTQNIETDAFPIFSPDGSWIAFGSKRYGNWDIFAIPAQGGLARRLTYHGGTEIPHGWSPDGKYLLFSGKRDRPDWGIFALDVNTLGTDLLCEDYAPLHYPSYSPDGKAIVYGRYGFHWTRPRYAGSAAAQIVLFSLERKNRLQITANEFQHLWTQFLPNGTEVITVTVAQETPSASLLTNSTGKVEDNPGRTPNLWRFDLEGNGRQLTHFVGGAVRFPTVASKSGDIAFEYETDLWLLRSGRKRPKKVELYVAGDEKQSTRRRETLKSGVTEAEPSPEGKLFAFGLKGDIWTVLIDKPKGAAGRGAEFARRLTDWAGDDSDFSWAPDGKKIYFTSDREFTTRIYEVELETLETKSLWNRSEDVTGLRISPDGKQLGFWVSGPEGGLHVMEIADGALRRIVKVPGPQWRGVGGGEYSWSPDMKWMAYTHRGESGAWNIWVVPADGGEPVNVTHLYAHHSEPTWSPDGKYLFFQSNRSGAGLYALPLVPEAVRLDDADIKFTKSTNAVSVKIDFENISRRIRKVASQNPQADLTVTRDGLILFLSEGDVWSATYDGKETKRLTTGGGKFQFRISSDGKKMFYIQNGELWTANIDGKGAEKVGFTADWERDVRDERRAAFTQFWRSYHRGFYDPNFHGRDWEAIRQRYEPLVDAVETDDEFATLLQMMVGELDSSHAEVKAAPNDVPSPVTPHPGFTFDYSHSGPGLRVSRVPVGAPGWYSKTEIRDGEYILAINGEDVLLNEHLYDSINDKQDRLFEFLVSTNTEKANARTVRYTVISQNEWNDLNYRNRIERLRDYAEARSEGKIGYLHMSAMGQSNQAKFEQEAYEYIVGKEAMIIDVRFNTGGNIADTLIDWLERKPHGYVRPRDGPIQPSPYRAWEKPVVVLMNEHSYSNAEIFSYAMRERGLAKLVGMRTPGYVIWTDALKLVDGTSARIPQSGFYRLDGTPQENDGEVPDVLVPLSPEDWLAGNDPQLDRAIEMLLSTPEVKERVDEPLEVPEADPLEPPQPQPEKPEPVQPNLEDP